MHGYFNVNVFVRHPTQTRRPVSNVWSLEGTVMIKTSDFSRPVSQPVPSTILHTLSFLLDLGRFYLLPDLRRSQRVTEGRRLKSLQTQDFFTTEKYVI